MGRFANVSPKMVAPSKAFNSRDPKKGNRVLLYGLSSRFLSNYGTGKNALKDPRVVLQTIAPAIDPRPPCIIITSISFSTTQTQCLRLADSYDPKVTLDLQSLQAGPGPHLACDGQGDRYRQLVTIVSMIGPTLIRPSRPAYSRNVAVTNACIDVPLV